MEEPIYLDDTVQSAQCHLSAQDAAPLPGVREKGRKGSLREHQRRREVRGSTSAYWMPAVCTGLCSVHVW